MSYFIDTSALAKRYISETGSDWLRATLEPATGCRALIARATSVELVSAITRRERAGALTAVDAAGARGEFVRDLADEDMVVEFGEPVAMEAMRLAECHALRGYDAIQLASALAVNRAAVGAGLHPVVLVSSDADLNAAARREGVSVEDPNLYS
ncbi:MAG: type II toxin-antitoxin system VapC family toxin [Armatimonadetes bacterium]|nr:type II toxin-antitoxin system VapC family toxin [Armatimonadota bacterium]